MSESSLLHIKGIRDGLLVTLGEAAWTVARQTLLERIASQPAFFQGARLALDVGNQPLHVAELSELRDRLSESGITLWAVLSNSPLTEATSQNLGLATRLRQPAARPAELQPARGIDDETALWVQKTLRSGTRIEFAGHIVVMGDVNPGAEVIAGGSIIVWGRLRGVVHAGAQGNAAATVCALDVSPTQLRIAGQIAIAPQRHGKSQPEVVRLKDGKLHAEPWNP